MGYVQKKVNLKEVVRLYSSRQLYCTIPIRSVRGEETTCKLVDMKGEAGESHSSSTEFNVRAMCL